MIETKKPDKLPTLNPCERGIFDRIIEAVAKERARRRSDEFRKEELRRNDQLIALRELRARQAKEAEKEEWARLRLFAVPPDS